MATRIHMIGGAVVEVEEPYAEVTESIDKSFENTSNPMIYLSGVQSGSGVYVNATRVELLTNIGDLS